MAAGTLTSVTKPEQERFVGDKSSLVGKNLHLSIEVREDCLLSSYLDKDKGKYLSWALYNLTNDRETTRSLKSILEDEMLNYKGSGSSVVFTHNSALLIPAAFFSQNAVKDYLKQQNLIKPNEIACFDFIKNNDCYSVYAVNSDDYNLLKHKYPDAAFRHHSSIFIEYLLALNKANSKNSVHVSVFSGYMDVVALQGNKLLLYNRYSIKTPNDFTYFLLWIYEELKLKPEDSPCIFYGEIEEKSEMFELASKYLKIALLAEKISRFTFSPMLENISTQRYHSLFMQYLCI